MEREWEKKKKDLDHVFFFLYLKKISVKRLLAGLGGHRQSYLTLWGLCSGHFEYC